jgi:hypothetical protein
MKNGINGGERASNITGGSRLACHAIQQVVAADGAFINPQFDGVGIFVGGIAWYLLPKIKVGTLIKQEDIFGSQRNVKLERRVSPNRAI